jgi:hypothetical protein
MAEPMSPLPAHNYDAHSDSMVIDDDFDMTFHEPPSSPFVSHVDQEDQENIAPGAAPTPSKPLVDFDDVPQSAFKVSPEKKFGLKDRASPVKMSPVKNLLDDFEEARNDTSRSSSKKGSPIKQTPMDRPESASSSRSQQSRSPSKSSRTPSAESSQYMTSVDVDVADVSSTPSKRPSSSHQDPALRQNEGLTVAMNSMEETRTETREYVAQQHSYDDDLDLDMDNTEYHPDGPELTSADMDDTSFSMFSEMPGIDLTKFAYLQKSPTKDGLLDVSICSGSCP